MEDQLARLFDGFRLTGDLAVDAPGFLRHHGKDAIARHVEWVAANAQRLAARFGADERAAVTAAWLHDISRVLPGADMVEPAEQAGVELLPEERRLPELIHGKLSAVMARRFFGVEDPAVLEAIGCHSTLRAGAGLVVKVLFVADKLAWLPQEAPYMAELEEALGGGPLAGDMAPPGAGGGALDRAVWSFLDWARPRYPVVHPWLREAHAEFARPCNG